MLNEFIKMWNIKQHYSKKTLIANGLKIEFNKEIRNNKVYDFPPGRELI